MSMRPFFVVVFFFVSFEAHTQDDPGAQFLTTVVPPSPDAAALGKYGEIPVNLYSGIPNISIPIFTLEGRDLALPIFLSYHAAGFRVEEIAPWTGLGFTLNAGGAITRTVRGIKDESSSGYRNLTAPEYTAVTGCTGLITKHAAEGLRDSEPDIFNFNVNGISGKFFFDSNGNVILETPGFIKLIPTIDTDDITSWRLVADDGTQYTFAAVEMTQTRTVGGEPIFSNTAWYLTEILAPNKIEKITLDYSVPAKLDITVNHSYQDYTSLGLVQGEDCLGEPLMCSSYSKDNQSVTSVYGRRLTRILTNKYEAILTADFSRVDLANAKALTNITIKNRLGAVLNSFDFQYDASGGRLKLLGMQEKGNNPAATKPPYSFTYNSTELPSITSKAQDHWGFYNGETSNSSLIPATTIKYANNVMVLPGGDRDPHGNNSLANLIATITYPTGGVTTFEFEPHVYSYVRGDLVTVPVYDNEVRSVSAIGISAEETCMPMPADSIDAKTVVIEEQQFVRLIGNVQQCTPAVGSLAPVLSLENGAGQVIASLTLTKFDPAESLDVVLDLPPGTYVLKAKVRIDGDLAAGSIYYKVQKAGAAGITHFQSGGGARIKRITSAPADGGLPIVTEYSYTEGESANALSSGVLVSPPVYSHYQSFERQEIQDCSVSSGSSTAAYVFTCSYYVRSSYSQLPMGTTSGSHIGYSRVTETIPGNGRTVHYFSSARESPDFGSDEFPFAVKTDNDWARGKMVKQETYLENGVLPIRKVENFYNPKYFTTIKGVTARKPNPYTSPNGCSCKLYDIHSAISRLDSTATEEITSAGTILSKQFFDYDANTNALPVKTTNLDSNGKVIVTNMVYPFDVSSLTDLLPAETLAIQQLVTDNRVSEPLETRKLIDNVTVLRIRKSFNIFPISNPLFSVSSLAELVDTRMAPDGQNFIKTSQFSDYSNFGKPQTYIGKDQVQHGFLWSEDEGNLFAHVENAIGTDIGFTSFETANGKGNFTYTLDPSADSKGGLGSHKLVNMPITKSGLNSQKSYLLTFWAKGGVPSVTNVASSNDALIAEEDGWRYFEKIISGTATLTISGTAGVLIDEVRCHPVGSRMTTYNYTNGHKVQSVGDINNVLTFYQYDDFNRLKLIKDHKKNIIKSIGYNYRQ